MKNPTSGRELDRRDFLGLATIAGVAAILDACSGGGQATTGPITPGPATITVTLADFAALNNVGGMAAVGTVLLSPVAVVRTGQSSYLALSRVCTHQGCVINLQSSGFACPCHGSRYDSQGNVLNGPAPRALARLSATLSTDGTMLTIT